MITIYALLEDAQIRYIGKTKKTNLEEKLNQHLLEAVEKPGLFAWINNLTRQGKKPEIKSIFTFSEEESHFYEGMFLEDFRHLVNVKPKVEVG